MPNLWFCPNIGARDTLELFRNPDRWSRSRSMVSVWQFYAQHIMADTLVDMSERPNWEYVGPNTYNAFLAVDAFRKLTDWGIGIAIEIGAVKPGCCDAIGNAQLTLQLIQKVEEAGGRVTHIAIDEPLPSSKSATWPDMMPGVGCNLSPEDAAQATVRFCQIVRDHRPDLTIGLIEAYPNSSTEVVLRFVQHMSEGGFHPQFLHLDVDRNALKKKIDDRQLRADMDRIARVCQRAPIPYGQVLWGQMFNSEVQYRASVVAWAEKVERFAVTPDTIIVQSWEPLRDAKDTPRNLPESDQYSHTHLMRTIGDRFGVTARV